MGRNLDLCEMLGVPEKMTCGECGLSFYTGFDDYDIDCGNLNPAPGRWKLRALCGECLAEHFVEVECWTKGTEVKPNEAKPGDSAVLGIDWKGPVDWRGLGE